MKDSEINELVDWMERMANESLSVAKSETPDKFTRDIQRLNAFRFKKVASLLRSCKEDKT